MSKRLIAFFRNNVEGRHGNDAEGEPCDLLMETEYAGPVHPVTGEELRCTCGYAEFEAVMRTLVPSWFREAGHLRHASWPDPLRWAREQDRRPHG